MTVLVPAYNEEAVIATCVAAALASDYPGAAEVLVLDDGPSTTLKGRAAARRVTDERSPAA